VSNELERTSKEVAMACSRYCRICLVGLRRATDTLVLIAIALAEIVTEQPLNISLRHYHYTAVLSSAMSVS
jgi:hypothetical protein